jgi:hypothetical protein
VAAAVLDGLFGNWITLSRLQKSYVVIKVYMQRWLIGQGNSSAIAAVTALPFFRALRRGRDGGGRDGRARLRSPLDTGAKQEGPEGGCWYRSRHSSSIKLIDVMSNGEDPIWTLCGPLVPAGERRQAGAAGMVQDRRGLEFAGQLGRRKARVARPVAAREPG